MRIVYSLTGGADGYEPWGKLISDKSGALYGTTKFGAANDEGTVFMLSQSAGKWTETTLHSFDSFDGDGANPIAGLTWSLCNQPPAVCNYINTRNQYDIQTDNWLSMNEQGQQITVTPQPVDLGIDWDIRHEHLQDWVPMCDENGCAQRLPHGRGGE